METTLYCVYEVVAVAVDPPEQKELVVPALVAVALVADKTPNSLHHLENSPRLKMDLRIILLLTMISLPRQTTLKLPMDGLHRSTILRATLHLWFYMGQILTLTPCLAEFRIRIFTQHHPPGLMTTWTKCLIVCRTPVLIQRHPPVRTRMSRQHRRTGRAPMLRRFRSI
ncbi:hypothetical protein INS49_001858 [Diaporthe citri]|uniref:uncharacterized protein n=1 Tax=Diaporthe citri TaxID=83186 RepID=UPI001C806D0C|nr:uncharacterized protein INS49_001858 [Diaporthe citri]KAG6367665.1 hypothetical protein INS49_001858 [Diaporthe citri]